MKTFTLTNEQYRVVMNALNDAICRHYDCGQRRTEAAITAVEDELRRQAEAQYQKARTADVVDALLRSLKDER